MSSEYWHFPVFLRPPLRVPADFFCALFPQARIDCGKRAAAEKSAVGGKRRRMCRGDDFVPGLIDERRFFLRRIAPENEDDGAVKSVDCADHGVRKCFPAVLSV